MTDEVQDQFLVGLLDQFLHRHTIRIIRGHLKRPSRHHLESAKKNGLFMLFKALSATI